MSKKVVYIGKDLESMSFAVNYHKWIMDDFRPFLGMNIVEVGAGTGSFSELLLDEKPEKLSVVEPSEMFEYLEKNISAMETPAKVDFYQDIFANIRNDLTAAENPDSIVYVNVLEHIEDDAAELKMIHETLAEHGRCFIFVPALMSLYGEFDRKIGHYRRYTKSELEEKCRTAGFKIVLSKYFDLVGIVPWYIKYKLLKSDSLGGGAVETYDKFAVPVTKLIESIFNPFVGKNILIVAEKI